MPTKRRKQVNVQRWLLFALFTTVSWGIWGALIEIPEKAGFPATLGYVVWALTMVPCALVALRVAGWKFEYDRRSMVLGSAVGLLGAGGQLLLFEALRTGPAFIVFPVVALYPVLTIILSVGLLHERARRRKGGGGDVRAASQWGLVLTQLCGSLHNWIKPTRSAHQRSEAVLCVYA